MLVVADAEKLPVDGARRGEREAWEVLFRRYQLPLYVYIFELVRDEQAALDLVQETFINASRHLASLREDGKMGSWLFGIAHQKCVQHWRRQKREWIFSEEEPGDVFATGDDPAEILVREEQEEAFMKLLEKLPEAQRSVLLLHFVEEFSIEEIAQITGTRPGTVKSRMHYARRALRSLWQEDQS